MKYSILLGRDMLDQILHSINYHEEYLTFFQEPKNIETKDQIGEVTGDITLKPHSVTEITVKDNSVIGECTMRGTKEIREKGLLIQRQRKQIETNKGISVIIHNVTGSPVKLGKDDKIIEIPQLLGETGVVMSITSPGNSDEKIKNEIRQVEIGEGDTEKEIVKDVRNILLQNSQAFALDESGLKYLKGLEHKIEVKDDTPLRQRAYKTDVRSQEIIDETVQKLLDNFNIKINNKLNDAVQDWHKTK